METGEDQRRVVRALCYKTKICPWHGKGKCNRGANCNFAHSPSEKKIWPVGAFRALHRRLDLLTNLDRTELLDMDRAELYDLQNARIEELVNSKLWDVQPQTDDILFDRSPTSSEERMMVASTGANSGSSELLREVSLSAGAHVSSAPELRPRASCPTTETKPLIVENVQASEGYTPSYVHVDGRYNYIQQRNIHQHLLCAYNDLESSDLGIIRHSDGEDNDQCLAPVEYSVTASTNDDASRESRSSADSGDNPRIFCTHTSRCCINHKHYDQEFAAQHAQVAPLIPSSICDAAGNILSVVDQQSATQHPHSQIITLNVPIGPITICCQNDETMPLTGAPAAVAAATGSISRHSAESSKTPPMVNIVMPAPVISLVPHEGPTQYYVAVPTAIDTGWFQNGSTTAAAQTCTDANYCNFAAPSITDVPAVAVEQQIRAVAPVWYYIQDRYAD
eukprot:Lankesteria_metandrocarpae@DN10369_c0_g1_i1.p1